MWTGARRRGTESGYPRAQRCRRPDCAPSPSGPRGESATWVRRALATRCISRAHAGGGEAALASPLGGVSVGCPHSVSRRLHVYPPQGPDRSKRAHMGRAGEATRACNLAKHKVAGSTPLSRDRCKPAPDALRAGKRLARRSKNVTSPGRLRPAFFRLTRPFRREETRVTVALNTRRAGHTKKSQ